MTTRKQLTIAALTLSLATYALPTHAVSPTVIAPDGFSDAVVRDAGGDSGVREEAITEADALAMPRPQRSRLLRALGYRFAHWMPDAMQITLLAKAGSVGYTVGGILAGETAAAASSR
jgi:hypothetical protein